MNTRLLSICVVALTLCSTANAHFHPKEMVNAVNSFITSLDDDQKKLCLFEFKSDDRQGWFFVPDKCIRPRGARIGLVLKKMNKRQRGLVTALLKTAASEMGHKQVCRPRSTCSNTTTPRTARIMSTPSGEILMGILAKTC